MTAPSASQQSSRTSTCALSQQPTLVGGITPPPAPPGEAFTRAIKRFRARLSGTNFTNFTNTTYEDLCREIIRIQGEQDSRKEMMHLSRISSCLEAMHQFGKTIEIFLNVADVIAFIWGPMKFLLLVSSCSYTNVLRLTAVTDCKYICRLI